MATTANKKVNHSEETTKGYVKVSYDLIRLSGLTIDKDQFGKKMLLEFPKPFSLGPKCTEDKNSQSIQKNLNENFETVKSSAIEEFEIVFKESEVMEVISTTIGTQHDIPSQPVTIMNEACSIVPIKPVFTCHICGMFFYIFAQVDEHYAEKHDNALLKCDFEGCTRQYKTYYTLREHYKVQHKNHKYKCPFCSAEYACRAGLRDHRKRKHPIESCSNHNQPPRKRKQRSSVKADSKSNQNQSS